MNCRHALVPVDFSGASHQLLPRIAEWMPEGSRLTLLHVVQGLDLPSWTLADPGMPREVREDIQTAEPLLEELVQGLASTELEVCSQIVIGQARAEAIVEFAQQNEIDLIALATHGHRGLQKFVLGSVADRVLRLSTLPVLVFPHPKEDDENEGKGEAGSS